MLKYVKCIGTWNSKGVSIIGKIYDTSVQADFAKYSWEKMMDYPANGFANWKSHFVEASEEEWCEQEGINLQYNIY